jgi:phosphoribosylamine--glycine ligase
VGVVLAAGGYPGDYRKGDRISGLPTDSETAKVFHAGTALKDGDIVTAGGRVLCATALGESVTIAKQRADALAAMIQWPGCFYRRDIAHRAIARENVTS